LAVPALEQQLVVPLPQQPLVQNNYGNVFGNITLSPGSSIFKIKAEK
jgi:hypothetical protein